MWLISYICIIGCTFKYFVTSFDNIVWIRGMSTFSAIDQKRKISIKKASIARLSNKEFHLCFYIFGICLWLNKLSIIFKYKNCNQLPVWFRNGYVEGRCDGKILEDEITPKPYNKNIFLIENYSCSCLITEGGVISQCVYILMIIVIWQCTINVFRYLAQSLTISRFYVKEHVISPW